VRRLALGIFITLVPLVALAQSDENGIDIVEVSGPLDAGAVTFMADAIRDAADSGQELVVLQLNSPGALDGPSLADLQALVVNPPIPVAIWVGPAPAVAYGGAAQLVLSADQRAIAPNSELGIASPTIVGDPDSPPLVDQASLDQFEEIVAAQDTGIELQPTIRQYIQELDGRTFPTDHGDIEVETIVEFSQEGESGVTNKEVTFIEPGLGLRFFRLAASPEAAFFFLVVGLTVVSFEFFAIGPGVAAAAAGISLLIGGWGIVNLPVRMWAVALVVLGWVVLTASYQKGGVIVMTLAGAVMLQLGGMYFVDGSGQIDPRWWLILLSVLAVLFFFLLAMPTVQRARFSTQVLGRESLIGATGRALVDFTPDGLVEVNGARWRGTAHREAGLVAGSEVVVTGVDGLFLEVAPTREDRENSND
jgi:membrane-bound serine protease (ClpP class)